MNIGFPLRVDGRGRTATVDTDRHLRDLIEQVLFTSPGERVMRPSFGSGLMGLVFEPGGPETEATVQYLVQAALQQWLGHLLAPESVEVTSVDGVLTVDVAYVVRATGDERTTRFRRAV